MTPEERRHRERQLDKQCRTFSAQATSTIDQWIEELNELSGLATQDIDTDVWDAMRVRVLDELDATQDRTPQRARALWMAIGCHYWVQRGVDAELEREE